MNGISTRIKASDGMKDLKAMQTDMRVKVRLNAGQRNGRTKDPYERSLECRPEKWSYERSL